MPALKTALRLTLAAALATALAAPALASPCAAPAGYVKTTETARAPLLRPFVLGGLAAVALHQRDNERWIELAVPNVGTAQRALAGANGVQAEPRLLSAAGTVLLACSSVGGTDLRVAQQDKGALATPLW
ncbi:hypothetical protein IP87_18605 [beta proteobacterium AAP121]|nr:hypothetical protein IP80_03240 [beta proteobacterium AAP65]KPF94615.1 hypothetical protein IP87_18605 [beta proteobacterium AAP121]